MVPNHSARTRNNLRSSAGRAPAGNSCKVQSQITDLQFLVEWLLRELKMDPFWTTVFILFEEKSVFSFFFDFFGSFFEHFLKIP